MHIKSFGYIEKANKLNEGEVEVIVNSGEIDASGERIVADGIDLSEYKKNPVILWAHDGYNLPIARAKKIWVEGKKLMAVAQFYLKDEFPAKVYNYIVDGFLKGVSIGGQVGEWGSDGMTITKMNMKEFSFVPIGMDAKALVTQKSFTKEQKTEFDGLAKAYARKVFTEQDNNGIVKAVEHLETLVAALKELTVEMPQTREDKAKVRVVLRQAQAVDHQNESVIKIIKKEISK